MIDAVLTSFLAHQYGEAKALADRSDLVDLLPLGSPPYQRFVVRYWCRSLVKTRTGITLGSRFEVGFRLGNDYLRRADVSQVVTLLSPPNVFLPNVSFPFICLGSLKPGTALVDLIHRVHEILIGRNVTMNEEDALNKEACQWARRHRDRLPLDDRPLGRPILDLSFRPTNISGEARA